MSKRKYYWLKMHKDFFDRHDLKIIESIPNGKEYGYFYVKMLLESIPYEGALRFSDTIPYNEEMLATITNTNVDIVRSAIKIFEGLGLMTIMSDYTFFMTETKKMLGEASSTERVRAFREREKLKQIETLHETEKIPTKQAVISDVIQDNETVLERFRETELELEIDKEIDIKKNKQKEKVKKFSPPTLKEVADYCLERNNNIDPSNFIDFYTSNGWKVGKNKMKDWKACVRTWERRDSKGKPNAMPVPIYSKDTSIDVDVDELTRDLEKKINAMKNDKNKED